jgi:hypothetical protein
MLTHMHPSPAWFACQPSPPLRVRLSQFEAWAAPGTTKCPESLCPPPALPSAARCPASRQRALPRLLRSYELMRRTKSLLPNLVFHLDGLVLAGCRQSLLGDGPSRRYLRSLCQDAWTYTPRVPLANPFASPFYRRPVQRASAKPSGHEAWHTRTILHSNFGRGWISGGSHSHSSGFLTC